jgi:hypothetical protein
MARKPKCHPDRKHAGRGLCNTCYMRAFRRADRERQRAYDRAYYAANRERLNARRREIADLEKQREQTRAWRAANPEKAREVHRRSHVKTRFGLTPEQDAALGNTCNICGIECGRGKGRGSRHIDHCHTTGRVRGVLCRECNMGLSFFAEDPRRFLNAVEYLCQS